MSWIQTIRWMLAIHIHIKYNSYTIFNWIVYSNVAAVCHNSVNGKSLNKFSGSLFVTSVVIKTKISDVQETCSFMSSTHRHTDTLRHTHTHVISPITSPIWNSRIFRKKQFEFRNYCGNLNEIISSGENSGKKKINHVLESRKMLHILQRRKKNRI